MALPAAALSSAIVWPSRLGCYYCTAIANIFYGCLILCMARHRGGRCGWRAVCAGGGGWRRQATNTALIVADRILHGEKLDDLPFTGAISVQVLSSASRFLARR